MQGFIDDVVARAQVAQRALARSKALGPFIDASLPIPRPFVGTGNIRLIIIGQDPTVQRESSRATIKTTLNLDRRGVLRTFLEGLCTDLNLSLDVNVYATNAAKGFFTRPPTSIKAVNVLADTAPTWLPILEMELSRFPDAAVVSLGQPVLAMLARDRALTMKDFWGYQRRWGEGRALPMRKLDVSEATVGRSIFPFVHQPTSRGSRTHFYRVKRAEYLAFVRREAGL